MHQALTVLKSSRVYLDYTERWLIASYCVENRCIERHGENGSVEYRVEPHKIANEINKQAILNKKINSDHVKKSFSWYLEMCMLFSKMPIEKPENSGEIARLQGELDKEVETYDALSIAYKECREKLSTCQGENEILQRDVNDLDRTNVLFRELFTKIRQDLAHTLHDVGEVLSKK